MQSAPLLTSGEGGKGNGNIGEEEKGEENQERGGTGESKGGKRRKRKAKYNSDGWQRILTSWLS
jgi:hypothetical protein